MQYGSEKVLCPFYKDETKNSIRCEGVISVACINNFAETDDKKQHLEEYCYTHYKRCPHANALYKKYDYGE